MDFVRIACLLLRHLLHLLLRRGLRGSGRRRSRLGSLRRANAATGRGLDGFAQFLAQFDNLVRLEEHGRAVFQAVDLFRAVACAVGAAA